MGSRNTIKIGSWAVCPTLNSLERDGETIKLNPRTMDVLVHLASHAPDVVSAEELIRDVWRGRAIGDGPVYQSINELRKALGDDSRDPHYIETIPKRGYRLAVPVEISREQIPIVGLARLQRVFPQRRRSVAAVLVGMSLLVIISVYLAPWRLTRTDPLLDAQTIAVLPFANLGRDRGDDYLGEGIAEEIIHALSNGSGLRVISRTSSFSFQGTSADIREIGERLGASVILEGSVRLEGDRLRIIAQLIDTASNTHLWSGAFDQPLADLITMERDIALAVADRLMGEEVDVNRVAAALPLLEDLDAYEYYLLGRQRMRNANGVWGRWEISEANRAIEYFRRAIAVDPSFARAYTGLADALLLGDVVGREITETHEVSQEVGKEAMAAIDEALALDPLLAEAHASQGLALQLTRQGSVRAVEAYRQAIALNPNLAYPYYRLGRVISIGVFDQFDAYAEEAVAALETAIELDPMSAENPKWLGLALQRLGRHKEAATYFERAAELRNGSTTNGKIHLALAQDQYEIAADLIHQFNGKALVPLYEMVIGHDDHARELFEELDSQRGLASIDDNIGWGYYPAVNAAHLALKAGHAETGAELLEIARPMLEKATESAYTGGGAYYLLASISAIQGQTGEALDSLEQAIAHGWTRHWYAERDPNLESLWDDARFQKRIADLKLEMDDLRAELEPLAALE